jgi:hypothetical protein
MTVEGISEEDMNDHWSVKDNIESLLKRLDGHGVTVDTLAVDIVKKRYNFERILSLLEIAAKFWAKASYCSSSYSTEREQSGFSNSPSNMKDLLAALTTVPQPEEPQPELVAKLTRRLEVIYEKKREQQEEQEKATKKAAPSIIMRSGNNARSTTRQAPRRQTKAKPRSTTTSCKFFASGNCRFGDQCRFRHDNTGPTRTISNSNTTKAKPNNCKFFASGSCRFGDQCRSSHEL